MKFFSAIPLFLWALSANARDDLRSCNANPECAARELADDCCPTNLAGIFLDCCEDKVSSCAANPGCAGLVDDCCPTSDGAFLYCCFDGDPADGGYKVRSIAAVILEVLNFTLGTLLNSDISLIHN